MGAGGTLAVMKQPSLRTPELDGVRGIAIFLVLIYHYFVIAFAPASPAAYAFAGLRLSWSGVDLFFVLSGFLIGGILIDNQQSSNYFEVFYVRRLCRIFPLYLFWLLAFCGLLLIRSAESPLPLWSYATFSQNLLMSYHNTFGPSWMLITWSLAVEEQFYFTLPFIIRYLEPRKLPWFLICFILAAPLLRVALSFSFSSGALAAYVLMPCRADALLLGVLCAWMLRRQQVTQFLTIYRKALYAAFVVLLMGTAAMTIKYTQMVSYRWSNLGYTWLALLYSCFLLIIVTERRGIIKTITMSPLLRGLGIIAYGVYLMHYGILSLLHELILHDGPTILNTQDLMVTMFSLTLTLILAYLSWKFFEKPLVAWGHGFNYQNATQSCHPIATTRESRRIGPVNSLVDSFEQLNRINL